MVKAVKRAKACFVTELEVLNKDNTVVAAFQNADNIRTVLPNRLPFYETVFAMTIHKSQGSEFNHVAVVLPDMISPILTRELLYTAVSRARKKLTIFASRETITCAIKTKALIMSGLRDQLQKK